MASDRYEVCVIGLGAMGSAAFYHFAKQGVRVVGVDRWSPPHSYGSSSGETRIIREAYFEDPAYVPMVQRAYQLWSELEHLCGKTLYLPTGGVMVGPESSRLIQGSIASAKTHNLPYEILSATDFKQRFPQFQPRTTDVAVLEPRAGVLFCHRCIEAHLSCGAALGGTMRLEERVLDWIPHLQGGWTVRTDRGEILCDRILITAGGWTHEFPSTLKLPLQVERQVLLWFQPLCNQELFQPNQCPIYIWEDQPGQFFYGFPDMGDGVKIARYGKGRLLSAEDMDRKIEDDDERSVRKLLEEFLPDANGALDHATTCFFTNTPDGHFWMDEWESESGREVWVASACSGHGFKHSSAIGEYLVDRMLSNVPRFDGRLFGKRDISF